jgi:hypothetical protein
MQCDVCTLVIYACADGVLVLFTQTSPSIVSSSAVRRGFVVEMSRYLTAAIVHSDRLDRFDQRSTDKGPNVGIQVEAELEPYRGQTPALDIRPSTFVLQCDLAMRATRLVQPV